VYVEQKSEVWFSYLGGGFARWSCLPNKRSCIPCILTQSSLDYKTSPIFRLTERPPIRCRLSRDDTQRCDLLAESSVAAVLNRLLLRRCSRKRGFLVTSILDEFGSRRLQTASPVGDPFHQESGSGQVFRDQGCKATQNITSSINLNLVEYK
jgi:hypothetical protein